MKIKKPTRSKAMDDAERRRPKKLFHGISKKTEKMKRHVERRENKDGGE